MPKYRIKKCACEIGVGLILPLMIDKNEAVAAADRQVAATSCDEATTEKYFEGILWPGTKAP